MGFFGKLEACEKTYGRKRLQLSFFFFQNISEIDTAQLLKVERIAYIPVLRC